jgi:hypothetical protein
VSAGVSGASVSRNLRSPSEPELLLALHFDAAALKNSTAFPFAASAPHAVLDAVL